jgi:hypothetical protein
MERRLLAERAGSVVREQEAVSAALAMDLPDTAAIEALFELGFTRDTLPAIDWAPIVDVAWADGVIDPGERHVVLGAAEEDGLPPQHPAHRRLREWLETRPGPRLQRAWRLWIASVARVEDEATVVDREVWLGSRLREVAAATGGWLGVARTSRDELDAIERIERLVRSARAA